MPQLIAPGAPPESSTEDFPKLADYMGQIVILGPTEETTIDTKYKQGQKATRCVGWAWVDRKLVTLGDLLVFWGKVRAQLAPAIEAGSYVVGRIVKDGRSYILDPVSDDKTLALIAAELDF